MCWSLCIFACVCCSGGWAVSHSCCDSSCIHTPVIMYPSILVHQVFPLTQQWVVVTAGHTWVIPGLPVVVTSWGCEEGDEGGVSCRVEKAGVMFVSRKVGMYYLTCLMWWTPCMWTVHTTSRHTFKTSKVGKTNRNNNKNNVINIQNCYDYKSACVDILGIVLLIKEVRDRIESIK